MSPVLTGLPGSMPHDIRCALDEKIKVLLDTLIVDRPLIIDPVNLLLKWVSYAPRYQDDAKYGLALQSVDTAIVASKIADGTLFTGLESSEKRRVLEPRYRYAAFIAGLFSNLPSLASAQVMSEDKIWSPMNEPLHDFVLRNGDFHLVWSGVTRESALWIVSRHIPEPVISYLNEANPSILFEMLAAIAPEKPLSRLQQVVSTSMERVISQYKSQSTIPVDKPVAQQINLENVSAKTKETPTVKAELITTPHPDKKEQSQSGLKAEDLYKSMGEATAALFQSIAEDTERKPEVAEQIKPSESGIAIPLALIAGYGVVKAVVLDGLKRSGIMIEQTRTHIIISHEASSVIFRKSK